MARKRTLNAVLRDFTRLMYEHDPFVVCPPDRPIASAKDAYDGEALSALSRMNEMILAANPDREECVTATSNVLQATFRFWMNDEVKDPTKLRAMSEALLASYLSMFPRREWEEKAK